MDLDQPPERRRADAAETASVAVALAGLAGVVLLTLTDHPHRAVLLTAGLLFLLSGARALWPGRPWFASRWRWLDVAFYAGVGALIWFFSPFTATMGIV
jgi:hypothetical protein